MSGRTRRWLVGSLSVAVTCGATLSPSPATSASASGSSTSPGQAGEVIVGGAPDRPSPSKATPSLRGEGTRAGYRQVRHADGSMSCANTRRLVSDSAPACRVRGASATVSPSAASRATTVSAAQALPGCSVSLALAVSDVVALTVDSSCGNRVSIYEIGAVGVDRVETLQSFPATVNAVPQQAGDAQYVAVAHDIILPANEWDPAGPTGGWSAQSATLTAPGGPSTWWTPPPRSPTTGGESRAGLKAKRRSKSMTWRLLILRTRSLHGVDRTSVHLVHQTYVTHPRRGPVPVVRRWRW